MAPHHTDTDRVAGLITQIAVRWAPTSAKLMHQFPNDQLQENHVRLVPALLSP